MNLIKLAALDSGAHENRNSPWETTVPEGWAVIPAGVAIPDSFPFVDVLATTVDGVPTVTALRGREMPPDDTPAPEPAPTPEEQLAALQAAQADTDSLLVEQEYRLTLLELNVSDTDDTENT